MNNFIKIFRTGMVGMTLCPLLLLLLLLISSGTEVKAATVTEGAQRFRLDNGLKIILKEDHAAPVVSIQVWVKTGSANETEAEAGITHFIEHMIFKGTPSRKTGEIARTIESSGGHINAYTSLDRTVYFLEIASSHFDTALDVLLDGVQHSLFDPLELVREREVVLEEYRRSLDIPERRLTWSMMALSYKKHPYRRPIIGNESTIRSFNRQAILNYMDKWYTPDDMVLVVVGDFNAHKALRSIRSLFKDFPARQRQKPSRPVEPEQTSPRTLVLNDKVQQVYLDISWRIPPLTHHHMPALELLEVILGDGKSSRLYSRLKMEKNLVHSIDAGAYAMADSGLFTIESTLNPKKFNSTLEAIAGEITRVRSEPVPASVLTKAKRIAEADHIYDLESMKGQAGTLAFFETMTGDMYNADEYARRMQMVTPVDIMNVAKTYLKPKNLSIGVLAPEGSKITLSDRQIMDIFSSPAKPPSASHKERTKGVEESTMVTLPNGLRVIIKENHRLPLVSLRATLLGGQRFEDPEHIGISQFVSEMLTRGTKKMSASEIASTVESWAGELDGFSGKNSFGISAKFLEKDLYQGLNLLADLILNPMFPENEIAKIREDTLAKIKAKRDSPRELLSDLFNKTLYLTHPYGRPRTGTEESITSITRSDLAKWYRSLAVPSNLVLAVVGDVRKDDLVAHLRELFRDFGSTPFTPPEILPEPMLQKEREAHLERPGEQVHLMIGYLGVDMKSRYNAPMELIDTALSGQGGRLFRELRDRQSLAYTVSSFRGPGLETGLFGVYIACDPEKLTIAREAIFKELARIKEDGLTKKELEDAKKYLLGNQAIDLQTNGSQAMRMALDELYGLGYDHLRRSIKEIEDVSLEDITRAARTIIIPDRHTLATVGPKQGG